MSIISGKPRKFSHDSFLINKDGYFFLRNFSRKERGFEPLTIDKLEKIWDRLSKESEQYRVTVDSFSKSVIELKDLLDDAGFTYIEDGKKVEGFYL